jgi:hypothetical protein
MHRERVEVLPKKFSLGCGAVRGISLSQDGDTPLLQPCYLGNISLINYWRGGRLIWYIIVHRVTSRSGSDFTSITSM